MQAAEAFLKQSFTCSNTVTSAHLNQAKKPSIGNELLVNTSTSGSHAIKSQKAGKSARKLASIRGKIITESYTLIYREEEKAMWFVFSLLS